MAFHVGQKVVCVNSSLYEDVLTDGKVYEVTGVSELDGISFVLISNGGGSADGGWYPHRFRPIVDPKAKISFTMGAPLDSEQWDNRRKLPVEV